MGVFPGGLLRKAHEIVYGLLGVFGLGVVVRQAVIGVLEACGVSLLQGAGFTVGQCGGAGWPLFNLYRRAVIARGERLVTEVEPVGSVAGFFALAARLARLARLASSA